MPDSQIGAFIGCSRFRPGPKLPMSFGSFHHELRFEFLTMPCSGFVYALLTGVLIALTDMLDWSNGPSISATDVVASFILLIGDLAASYAIMMAILRRPTSVKGALRFAAAWLLLIAALILTIFVGVLAAALGGIHVDSDTAYPPIIAWAILVSPLTAWPVARAVSAHPAPVQLVWRASRGHRWILAGMSLITAVTLMFTPEMSTVGRPPEAIVLATERGAIDGIVFLLGLCVSVTAWKFAVRQEPALRPAEDEATASPAS